MRPCLLSMRLSSLGPFSKPCSNNSDPPGATLPAGFLFALVGGPPLQGRFAAMCRPPSLFACRLRGGYVLHFLFPGEITPGFIFLSSCALPVALCAVPVSLAWAYGVPRGPLLAVPLAVGLAYPAAGAPVWGLLGPSCGVVRVRAWPEAVRACPAWAGRFFAGAALIAPPGLTVGCVFLRQSR